ncbi:metallophosphoesterase family protein [Paenibacillus sp. MBLB4367]|uniref:metallophosphoesterase family protein n=1 Tax=Paenibacillus sp. MBLB4367 TaxID=3384767 RepID=UPI0039080965
MLRIALAGDLHYFRVEEGQPGAEELEEGRNLFFHTYLRAFLDCEADWHISIGDWTNRGHEEEFKALQLLLQEKGVRFRLAPGNHDTDSLPKERIAALTGAPAYDVVHTNEATLAFLDTAKEMSPANWEGEVGEEQLAWLETVVRDTGSKPLLVFAHHPVYGTTADSTEKWLSIHPENRLRYVLAGKDGPGVYFNGHNHVNSIVQSGQWHFVQSAAVLCHPSYKLIEVDDGYVSVKEIPVLHEDLLKGWETLKSRFTGFYFVDGAKAQGSEADRNRLIEL